ncbi:MAG: helix-hairpin-helix domain-containing protein [Actinomycetaceae bacterium]|nr:helix-hairpin-helix domain-containing protein [Actinomycetaceae bacterium]
MDYNKARDFARDCFQVAAKRAQKNNYVHGVDTDERVGRWVPSLWALIAVISVVTVVTVLSVSAKYTQSYPAHGTNNSARAVSKSPRSSPSQTKKTAQQPRAQLVVHVVGAVNKPGLITVEEGSRVSDVIEKCDGLRDDANGEAINMARKIVDAEQIYIPTQGEQASAGTGGAAGGGVGTNSGVYGVEGAHGGTGSGGGGLSYDGSGYNGKININHADVLTFQQLDGIGPALSQRIVEYRQSHGLFSSVDELDNVPGIGPALMQRIQDKVTC